MLIQERTQALIHLLEVGGGARVMRWFLTTVALVAMLVLYDGCRAYHSFNSPEAMDAAQLGRNIAEGKGYTTDFIRPFSLFLMQKHYSAQHPEQASVTNILSATQIETGHPDLANAPLYPVVLAGLFKATSPQWQVETREHFWSEGGNFRRYKPEFHIALFNQFLFFIAVVMTFFITKKLFDTPAAWLTAVLVFASDVLWKFSVSGLPTMLMMVLLLGLVWCLIKIEEGGRAVTLDSTKLLRYAVLAGALTALGMLTRYSLGWVIVPVVVYLVMFGGVRRAGLATAAAGTFLVLVVPWIMRNEMVSGTLFGTAGYAAAEGVSAFPGSRLMQSFNPDLGYITRVNSSAVLSSYVHKLMDGLRTILEGDIFRLGGGWLGILFFAGLLLGLRNTGARRLRYFTVMCLGMFIFIQAMGHTYLSMIAGDYTTENLLVLLTPLIIMFGVGFFLTLVGQMDLPALEFRYGVILALVLLRLQPLVSTLVESVPVVAYPPYYPPAVQRICGWMDKDELMMSDVPWAVAWYGDHQCAWTTYNSKFEFSAFNAQVKPVRGLYLSMNTLNGRLLSDCLQGSVDSWNYFVYVALASNNLPTGFPLKYIPDEYSKYGLFLTDRQRW
jgi:hypothetical protein